MQPSGEFIIRILGALMLFFAGLQAGLYLDRVYGHLLAAPARVLFPLIGFLIGLVLTPYVTTRPAATLRRWIARLPAASLFSALTGLLFGLLASALLSVTLWLIPLVWVRTLLMVIFTGLIIYTSVLIFLTRQEEVWGILLRRQDAGTLLAASYDLVDTSALIDGRLLPLLQMGLLERTLLIPRFILQELQSIADDKAGPRRRRGRRGIDNLRRLQDLFPTRVQISDIDVPDRASSDEKLVRLAQQLNARILTVDYNLAQIAQVHGIPVLHLNKLLEVLLPPVHVGDVLHILVEDKGRNPEQGVGYLEDGTMVVVENGLSYIGQRIAVEVTKILPTQGGRIVFAQPLPNASKPSRRKP